MARAADTARIVHLTDFASVYPGSFVPALEAARRAVEQRGWTFEAVFQQGAEQRAWYQAARDAGMSVRAAPPLSRRQSLAWVRALLAESPAPTVLHTHFASWDIPAVLAARSQRDRVAIVWHRHGPLDDPPLRRLRQAVRFATVGRRVDAHLCVGPEVYARALARCSPPRYTQLFPNAIDLDRFMPITDSERAHARAALELDPEHDVLATFTWQWERKGGDLVLRALRELLDRGRSVVLLIVGSEPRAHEVTRALGLERSVHALMIRPDVRPLYAAADVFVTASAAEGMPFAVLEALACGTPVVASDIPEHRDLARSLPACQLAARTPEALSAAIAVELDLEPSVRAERLAVSRKFLESNAGLDSWAQRLCDIYARTLAARANGRPG